MTLPCDNIKVIECNMMEVDGKDIPSDGNSFTFSIKPFEVKTFRVKI
jgi:alpha-mannosidase